MNVRLFSWTGGLVAAAAVLICGCARQDAIVDARSPKAVRLVAVESSMDAGATTYSAVIAPNAQVDLAFRVSGYVVEIRRGTAVDGRSRAVEPGASIARGTTLARI